MLHNVFTPVFRLAMCISILITPGCLAVKVYLAFLFLQLIGYGILTSGILPLGSWITSSGTFEESHAMEYCFSILSLILIEYPLFW